MAAEKTISVSTGIRSRPQSLQVPPCERIPGIDGQRLEIRRLGIADPPRLIVRVAEVVPYPGLPRGFPHRVLPQGDLAAVHRVPGHRERAEGDDQDGEGHCNLPRYPPLPPESA